MANNPVVKKQFSVVDAHELDSRIPRNLIIAMEGKPFVLKAGLEWKAIQLFGVGNWSMETELVTNDPTKHTAVCKARVKVNGAIYEDYGEASPETITNPRMLKYYLHLAVTRAGNRALRRATACGFTSVEELGSDDAIKTVAEAADSQQTVEAGESENFPGDATGPLCSECGKAIPGHVASYSHKQFGKYLCYNDQLPYKTKKLLEEGYKPQPDTS